MYDVIVIGAGPSGCVTARTLAKSGLNVLLLEKCKLPRYKSCSGVLIDKSIRLVEEYFECCIPESITCTPIKNKGMVFVDDLGKEYKFKSRGLNIWRDKFDYWLAMRAKESGTTIKDNCSVTSLQENIDNVCVSCGEQKEYTKYVVDCSGVVGVVGNKQSNIITYQTYNKGSINLDLQYFYAYLQPELSGYDAWFNVKDDMLVLGVSTANAKDVKKYYNNFIEYMTEKNGLVIDTQLKEDKWLIRNVNNKFNIDYGNGRIFKAGENAGFLNPMGEGISSALESGYILAMAIIENFDNKQNVVAEYKKNVQKTKDYMIRQWKLVGRMSKKFNYMCEE